MNDDRLVLVLDTQRVIDDGCFSILRNGSHEVCKTLERTFDDGKPVIPAGRFKCVKSHFNRGNYDTFEITGVEDHDRLLVHRGNTEYDSVGCILVGLGFGTFGLNAAGKIAKEGEDVVRQVPGVTQSGIAFNRFWELVKEEDWFWLEVINR